MKIQAKIMWLMTALFVGVIVALSANAFHGQTPPTVRINWPDRMLIGQSFDLRVEAENIACSRARFKTDQDLARKEEKHRLP